MARISVGTVTPVPKGDYSPTATYNRLNWVKYNGALYCCKANGVVGVSPENTEFWMKQLDAPTDADGVNYDNSTSGLESANVQGAIDEVVADLGESSTALNNKLELAKTELQVLGWNVPEGMPVKNTLVNGVLTQNVGRILATDLTWGYNGAYQAFRARNVPNMVYDGNVNNVYCSKYPTYLGTGAGINADNVIVSKPQALYGDGTGDVTIKDTSLGTSVDSLKTKIKGMYIYYELATPITHTVADTSSVQEMISDEWISTKTYAVGEYCIHSNKLWKCKVQNSNVTPTEGTYWEKVSVGSELKEKVNVLLKEQKNLSWSGNINPYSFVDLTFDFSNISRPIYGAIVCDTSGVPSGFVPLWVQCNANNNSVKVRYMNATASTLTLATTNSLSFTLFTK